MSWPSKDPDDYRGPGKPAPAPSAAGVLAYVLVAVIWIVGGIASASLGPTAVGAIWLAGAGLLERRRRAARRLPR